MRIELGYVTLSEELDARRAAYELAAHDTASERPVFIVIDCQRAGLNMAVAAVKQHCAAIGTAWPAICEQAINLLQADESLSEPFLYHAVDAQLTSLTPADLTLNEITFSFDDANQLEGLHLDCRLLGVMTRVHVEDDLSVVDLDFGD